MKKYRIDDMEGGWFVGNFQPSAFTTKDFEVAFVKHKKGQFWEKHYHKISTEITLILKGKVKINDQIYSPGDIFVIYPKEVADPTFLEDSEVVVVKTPSDVNDKYVLEK